MTSFRSAKSQAKHLTIQRVKHYVSRHQLKDSRQEKIITSIGTEKKYFGNIKRFISWCIPKKFPTSVGKVTAEIAEKFLNENSANWTQKTLDGYRQAIEMVFKIEVNFVTSKKNILLTPRAYKFSQIFYLANLADEDLAFSIQLAAATGLRAVELDTIACVTDYEEDNRDWLPERFIGKKNSTIFVVIGKGGLRRKICVPNELTEKLELRRLAQPIRKTQREIHYRKFYSIVGGHSFSQRFSRLSIKEFGWSTGAHGLRHHYAQERISELQRLGFSWDDSLKIVSQELGHFSTQNTHAYLR